MILEIMQKVNSQFSLICLEIKIEEAQSFHNLVDFNKYVERSNFSWSSLVEESITSQYSMDELKPKDSDSFTSNDEKMIFESENYKVVNEYSKGNYFGEISWLTKYLPVTCTIRAIWNTVCGVIQK